jgi:two-component system, OmpR family, KDP operon response regulator KdpE
VTATIGARVLLVEDDEAVRRVVRRNLEAHGFRVEVAETGRAALGLEPVFHPDVILLDLGLPDIEGLSVIRSIRERTTTPIIVLTARDLEADKVQALDTGADDYLTKPFGVDELLARVRVALRRAARPVRGTHAVFRTGALEVDLERRTVSVAGGAVSLTPTEYALLTALVSSAGMVVTESALLRRVWGPGYDRERHYVHVYMARLRKKLELDPQQPRFIRTEPGVGYRLLDEPEASLSER